MPHRADTAIRSALLALLVASGIGASAASPPPDGMATLRVDATEAPRGIMSAHLELRVVPGPLTLVYPKWLPGRHSPAGPLTSLGGPRFTLDGQTLEWRRDPLDFYAFHLNIPAGARRLAADMEILTSPAPD